MIYELLVHLGKKVEDRDLKLYIGGGSFGTVPAQILFGASINVFPFASAVQGLLLLAPFSPFRLHKEYAVGMTWPNWISIGPPSSLPFRILPRLLSKVLQKKLSTPESAEVFIRETFFDSMKDVEKQSYAEYRARYGLPEGYVERSMARDAARSVEHSWEGFLMTSQWLHADWGFEPHSAPDKPVSIVCSSADLSAHDGMAVWLEKQYNNAKIQHVEGGHLAALFHLQDIIEEFLHKGK